MKWMTQKEAREASQGTFEQAIDSAIKHWTQLATADNKELKRKYWLNSGKNHITDSYCALCLKYNIKSVEKGCKNCPAAGKTGKMNDCCKGLWLKGEEEWNYLGIRDGTFTKAAKKVMNFLIKLKKSAESA